MKHLRSLLLPLIFIVGLAGQTALGTPQAPPQNLVQSLANTHWDGAVGYSAKGNSPAKLEIRGQNGSLTGSLSYDGFEETLAITVTAPAGIRLKGVSFRDLQGQHRQFGLDDLTGQITQGGHVISGKGADNQGTRSTFEFRRVSGN